LKKLKIAKLQLQVPETPLLHPPSSSMHAGAKHEPPPRLQSSSTPWNRRKSHHPGTPSRRIEIVERISASNFARRIGEEKSTIVDQEANDRTQQQSLLPPAAALSNQPPTGKIVSSMMNFGEERI
jgi:hypothetical protein